MNGEGGGIGPELNSPTNPTDYRDVAWLRQWIDDPASLVAVARMPRLNVKLKERSTIIDDVIAYLSAMAKHKVDPSSRAGDGS
jgi:cytochrome c1